MPLWYLTLLGHIVIALLWKYSYRHTARASSDDTATTVLLQLIAATTLVLCIPLFPWKLPESPWVYAAVVGYALVGGIASRLQTTARKEIPVSLVSIVGRLEKVFLFALGIVLLHEPLTIAKVIGGVLMIAANVLVLRKEGKWDVDRYVIYYLIALVIFALGSILQVDFSLVFNLPFVLALLFGAEAFWLLILLRPFKAIVRELRSAHRKNYIVTGVLWGVGHLLLIYTYQLGSVSTVTIVLSAIPLLAVISSCIFLKERDRLWQKFLASLLIILGVYVVLYFGT